MNSIRSNSSVQKRLVLTYIIIAAALFAFNNIKATKVEAEETEDNKIIYLTFDDGPSVMTDIVLDILKEQDIKATFFLIGNQIADQKAVTKRIYEEGHSIGLHTFTHKFNRIYPNRQNFMKEMKQCQNEIYSVTGIRPNIIRFPGGSYKRLSKSFLNTLHDNNFRVYDWNAYISDGINYKTPVSKLVNEATKTTVSEYPIVLLMHCDYMHKNTCKALPIIIKYYKDKGFQFKTITEDTPECTFPISKSSWSTIGD